MCGICGFLTKNKIDLEQLKTMNQRISHRGPNDSGEDLIYAKTGEVVGLAHSRLSILDLSANGHQPMYSFDKKLCIAFNGEIYNYKELNKKLDYPFTSTCDTETILAAYRKWGKECVDYLDGMFAFAIYDLEESTLFLARDRIGKKPLYYWLENNQIVFASELKAIMEFKGFPKVIKNEVIGSYLLNKYITAPNTIFENVYKLCPGEYLIYHDEKIETKKYWNIVDVYNQNKGKFHGDYSQAKEALKLNITSAVKKRLMADVPIGSFLSGGYDSTLITAIAQEGRKDKLKTFSIGFDDVKYNEAKYAKEIAEYIGTDHVEYYVSNEDIVKTVDKMAKTFDEPFSDNSQIPMLILSELTKQDVSVVLSGDGGDEFFCGYEFYDLVYKVQKLDMFGSILYQICKPFNLVNKLPYRIREIVENRDKGTKTQFGKNAYIELCHSLVGKGMDEKYNVEQLFHEENWQVRRMLLDMIYFLPDDILCKVDRTTMAHALEARAPLLDIDLIALSFQLPHEYKYYKGEKKRILKDITHEYVPKEMLDRPKQGFVAPISKWMRTIFREELIEVSRKEKLAKQAIFNPLLTEKMVDNYVELQEDQFRGCKDCTVILWGFFMFQRWYKEYIENI